VELPDITSWREKRRQVGVEEMMAERKRGDDRIPWRRKESCGTR
jgi:hypothetical protein